MFMLSIYMFFGSSISILIIDAIKLKSINKSCNEHEFIFSSLVLVISGLILGIKHEILLYCAISIAGVLGFCYLIILAFACYAIIISPLTISK